MPYIQYMIIVKSSVIEGNTNNKIKTYKHSNFRTAKPLPADLRLILVRGWEKRSEMSFRNSFNISLWNLKAHFFHHAALQNRKREVSQQWNLQTTWGIHMQGLACTGGQSGSSCPFGQYLDLGLEATDVHTTGRALHADHIGADRRQWEAPVLFLLGAPKVNHQPTAGVG